MTEQAPEETTIPEPSPLESVARAAAEAAVRALADPEARLLALELQVAEILAALTTAASPQGNAARLADRLDGLEASLAQLAAAPPAAHPEQQQLIDDLRLKVATLERNTP
jgi:hypothetical protein